VISLRFWQEYHKPFSEIQKGAFMLCKKQKSISWDALFLSRVDKKDAICHPSFYKKDVKRLF